MNFKVFFTALIGSALVISLQAAPKKTTPAKPPVKEEPKPDNTYPLDGEVVKVTPTMLVIQGAEGKEDRKFAFTETTKIVSGEKPSNYSQIKVGNHVGGLVRKVGKGDDVLLKVDVKLANDPSDKGKDGEKKPASSTASKKKTS